MILAITGDQRIIAEMYWGKSWMFLHPLQVEEALDWWNYEVAEERYDRWQN